jgi:hypothetical protein
MGIESSRAALLVVCVVLGVAFLVGSRAADRTLAGEPEPIDPEHRLHGRVVDDRGLVHSGVARLYASPAPIPVVDLLPENALAEAPVAHGEFAFGVGTAEQFIVRVDLAGLEPRTVVMQRPDASEAVIAVGRRTLRGRLLDPAGRPVAGALVLVCAFPIAPAPAAPRWECTANGHLLQQRTQPDGTFRFSGLPRSLCDVQASGSGADGLWWAARTWERLDADSLDVEVRAAARPSR